MNVFDRRAALKLLGAIPIFLHEGLWNSADAEPLVNPGTVDWSQAVIENMMVLKPDPASLGIWGYAVSLYLYGQYLFYKRHGDRRYLDYVQGWVDCHVDKSGKDRSRDHITRLHAARQSSPGAVQRDRQE